MTADFRSMKGFIPEIRERVQQPGKLTQDQIQEILDSFLGVIVDRLVDNQSISIPGFGRFTARVTSNKLYFTFRPYLGVRRYLKVALQGRQVMGDMEKYGVVQKKDEDEGKTAEAKDVCIEPGCGKPLEKDAAVKKCPEHGTEPFESKEESSGDRKT